MSENLTVGLMRPTKSSVDLAEVKHADIIDSLLREGLNVVQLGGRQGIEPDPEGEVVGAYRVTHEAGQLISQPLQEAAMVHAALNIRGSWDNGAIPTLNDRRVLAEGRLHPFMTQHAMRLGVRAIAATPAEFDRDQLDELYSDEVEILPVIGLAHKSSRTLHKRDVAAFFGDLPEKRQTAGYVVREHRVAKYNRDVFQPTRIKSDRTQLLDADPAGLELLVYRFGKESIPVARLGGGATRRYIELSPEVLFRGGIMRYSNEAMAILAEKSGVPVGDMAVSLGFRYGRLPHEFNATWALAAVNVREPEVPSVASNPQLARELHQQRTKKLAAMAERRAAQLRRAEG